MSINTVQITQPEIDAFCQRHHIAWLALFGSVLRDDFSPESDIDVLVRFKVGHTPGWEIVDMADELTVIFGRPVDLNTPEDLSDTFRDEVLERAYVLYK